MVSKALKQTLHNHTFHACYTLVPLSVVHQLHVTYIVQSPKNYNQCIHDAILIITIKFFELMILML